jgi:hypothetical protein
MLSNACVQSEDFPTLGASNHASSHYSGGPDTDECYQFIAMKLKQCQDSHEECSKQDSSPLPKRAIYVGASDEDLIRLVETQGMHATYAALSHCWGKHQPITGTKSNMASLSKNIPWEDLPAVFQDAIRVCRRLQIKYLWIDSLCIMQDSQDDWELESSKMCDYYENAFFTIAAASSPDSSVSFLRDRNSKWSPETFKFVSSGGTASQICARRRARGTLDEDHDRLSRRAWALQEVILSRRILYYMASRLMWRCRTDWKAETHCDLEELPYFPRLNPPCLMRPGEHTGHNIGSGQVLQSDEANTALIWESFAGVVEEYSDRELTYVTDKLPALSSLVSRVHESVRCRYLAGLWEDNLLYGLCWRRARLPSDFCKPPGYPPSQYIAPTWSWASVTGEIMELVMKNNDFRYRAKVVDVQCHVSGLNPFGKVSGGYLVLESAVAEVTLTCSNPYYNCYYIDHWIAGQERKSLNGDFAVDCFLTNTNGKVTRATPGQRLSPFTEDLSCILLGGTGSDLEPEKRESVGLVLGKSEHGAYCRLGFLYYKGDLFQHATTRTIRIE